MRVGTVMLSWEVLWQYPVKLNVDTSSPRELKTQPAHNDTYIRTLIAALFIMVKKKIMVYQ